ncbi:hypothetical protein ARMGADRAFT_1069181 [Armillaria gallica]|uniref:Uncharacterized protein n=1 Tax=Armillaria gallica TaxID=47427 RepID=A0A2H3CXN3_ARMGA|nr:hypothetical protein ARMGADRAFT_1069181 [Armillaria gallica]
MAWTHKLVFDQLPKTICSGSYREYCSIAAEFPSRDRMLTKGRQLVLNIRPSSILPTHEVPRDGPVRSSVARKRSRIARKRLTKNANERKCDRIYWHTYTPSSLPQQGRLLLAVYEVRIICGGYSQPVEQKVPRYPLRLMVLQVEFPKDVHKEDKHIAMFTFIEESTRLARERKLARVARKILRAPRKVIHKGQASSAEDQGCLVNEISPQKGRSKDQKYIRRTLKNPDHGLGSANIDIRTGKSASRSTAHELSPSHGSPFVIMSESAELSLFVKKIKTGVTDRVQGLRGAALGYTHQTPE